MLKNIFTKNKIKMARLEAEKEVLENESAWYEHKAETKNTTLRSIYTMITNFESKNTYGEAGYRDLFRQIKEKVLEDTEKKLSDEIFPHYTSNSR